MKSLNKNISVWRGSDTPPTKYHIWIKGDNSILIFIDGFWKEITSSGDKKNLNRLIDNSTYADSFVDLDLPSGTLWCKHNFTADKETDTGEYYQWGALEGQTGAEAKKYCTWSTCPGNNNHTVANDTSLNEWDELNTKGYNLLPQVQAPYNYDYGATEQMPTREQIQELVQNTDHEWTTINKVSGCKFISQTDSSKYIFIPAGGYYADGSLVNEWNCYIWSITEWNQRRYKNPTIAYNLYISDLDCGVGSSQRYYAMPIRTVLNPSIYLPSKSGTLAVDDIVTSYDNGLMSSDDKVRLDSLVKMSAEDTDVTDYDNVFTELDVINSLCHQINDNKEGESTTETVLNLIEQINN